MQGGAIGLLTAFVQGSRRAVMLRAAVTIGLIAVLDYNFEQSLSIGFLYLFPMLMVGSCLNPRWVLAAAVLCTGLAEVFDPLQWKTAVTIPRLILMFSAFLGAGLFVLESTRSRRQTREHVEALEREARFRRSAEEQLRFLIRTSPAAIFVVDERGMVLLANDSAATMVDLPAAELPGAAMSRFFPSLASVFPLTAGMPPLHTSMECRGAAQDDHIFLARMWFSTYQTEAGLRLAAVVTDSSEELRDREEFSLQQVLSSSEMMVSALCHEIRNVCGAISMLHGKLRKNPALAADADYLAQGSLIESLLRMAGTELRKTPRASAERVDLVRVLEELRIVIEPALQEEKIEIEWNVPRPPAAVWAEHHALLQVFLNIVKNSVRAMENSPRKVLQVVVSVGEATTVVRVIDSGPGVATPEVLFRPFQPGAQDNGLGLFLSRAFVRSFGGEITHEEPEPGCCFAVRLVNFECGKPPARSYEFPAVASRRSQTVSDESCAPAGNGS